jgi:uncharacterized surface protein with fasciclin (FAS1) repeats
VARHAAAVVASCGKKLTTINDVEMNTMTRTLQAVAAAVALGAPMGTILAQGAGREAKAGQNIVEVAVNAGQFKTLVAAVTVAGLAETLAGAGPFTVFAPTDEAFAKLPAGTVEALLADKAQLTAILTYHVVPGRVMAADIVTAGGARAATVNGQELDVVIRDGKVYAGGAQVVAADIGATNGVIHVVDTVILPPAAPAARSR